MKFLVCVLFFISTSVYANEDADFLAARDAFRAGNAKKLAQFAQRLKKSPLEVYVSYYQLSLELEAADVKTIKQFLTRPEDTPVVNRLRIDWLKQLGKKQQWDIFDVEYLRVLNEDTELACYALQSRLRNHANEAMRDSRGLWFTGKAQPVSCGVPFEAAITAGIISEKDIDGRMHLALEAGNVALAKQMAARLTGDFAVEFLALDSAARDVSRYLDKLSSDVRQSDAAQSVVKLVAASGVPALPANPPSNVVEPVLSHPKLATHGRRVVALFALQREAKQSVDVASAHWAKLAAYFPTNEQQYFYSWLAFEAARKLDERALQWYKLAGDAPLSEQQYAWRVRIALRAQDWAEVLSAINAMTTKQQSEGAWRYWKGRALQTLGSPLEARKLFAPLSAEYNFYGQLAGEELASSSVMSAPAPTYKPSKEAVAEMTLLPGAQRTMALYRMSLGTDALEEWRWFVRNFNDRELLTAAEVARSNEMYDRAIGAAEKTVNQHDFSMRYLAPYRDALQEHIRENNLDEAWVFGLMRQESRFVTRARSNVGAAGLMQIMPATARWVARKLGLKSYRNELIHQMDTNMRLGTYYMKTVLAQFDDSPVLASAAYNAGPSRARQWRGSQPLEGAIYAESIPFDETRDYVKKVMSNTLYYAYQFGAAPRSLKQRMGVIAGKSVENQQPVPDEK
ncbi:MAG: transglycosylase SLT domain-containing protein [Gallionella sp.]|nr:lytic transglycosylase domain-containing protein [Gallionella sp.]